MLHCTSSHLLRVRPITVIINGKHNDKRVHGEPCQEGDTVWLFDTVSCVKGSAKEISPHMERTLQCVEEDFRLWLSHWIVYK